MMRAAPPTTIIATFFPAPRRASVAGAAGLFATDVRRIPTVLAATVGPAAAVRWAGAGAGDCANAIAAGDVSASAIAAAYEMNLRFKGVSLATR